MRLLLRKISPSQHKKYINYILPKQPWDCSFVETVEALNKIFGEHTSLFNARFNWLNITKCDTEDFMTYSGFINKQCKWFKISTITDKQFKCLIFACRLRSASDRDVCIRILSKIEQNPDITLQQVTEQCRWLVNLKHDSDMVQHPQSTLSKDNSHWKQHERNLHLLAGIVVADILLRNAPSKLIAAANATGKVTKMDSAHHRGAK